MVLAHVLAPISQAQLLERQAEISSDVSSRMLREGVFVHPTRGVTFFVEEISPSGALGEVMLTDSRDDGQTATYTASRATLLRQDGATMLVLLDGMIQLHDAETGRLSTTGFERFVYDVTNMTGGVGSDLDLPQLQSSASLMRLSREAPDGGALFTAEIHKRTSEALFAFSAILLAFSVLTAGRFSRSC